MPGGLGGVGKDSHNRSHWRDSGKLSSSDDDDDGNCDDGDYNDEKSPNHVLQSTTASPVSHPAEQIRQFLESDSASWHPCSPEYVNYALALLVFAVR